MMNQLTYPITEDIIYIDARDAEAFRQGHLTNSINFTRSNMNKYGYLIPDSKAHVLVIDEALEEEVSALKAQVFHGDMRGYILDTDIPKADLVESKTISAADFLALPGGDYILLDVRHPGEITRPAPEKALLSLPLETFNFQHPSFSSEKTIYTLCGSGNRGTLIASLLKLRGFDAVVIEGGIKAIQEKQA
ncbi:rhodanese-like domain-containing protein [Aerococcaceae bacterium DSM 111022]|nr:rhodanese-like domain-containing protein [Aerococcaceae bacterium DSM 111022]